MKDVAIGFFLTILLFGTPVEFNPLFNRFLDMFFEQFDIRVAGMAIVLYVFTWIICIGIVVAFLKGRHKNAE